MGSVPCIESVPYFKSNPGIFQFPFVFRSCNWFQGNILCWNWNWVENWILAPIQPTFWSHCWNVHIIFCVLNKSQLFIFFWNKLLELPKLLLSPVKTLNFIQSIIIILMVCSEKMQILLKVCNGAVKFTLMFELRSWEFVWEDASKLLDYVRRQMFENPWKKTRCQFG